MGAAALVPACFNLPLLVDLASKPAIVRVHHALQNLDVQPQTLRHTHASGCCKYLTSILPLAPE